MHFVVNSILNTTCKFDYDDITMTSFINIRLTMVTLTLNASPSINPLTP